MIEIIVTAAVLALMAGIAFRALSNFKSDKSLDGDFRAVSSLVDEAREATLAARDDAPWGVHFQSDQAVLFKNTYQAGNANNTVYTLSKNIYISSITLGGGGSDVIFKHLYGTTDNSGTTTLSERTGSSTRSIIISASGVLR